MRIQLNGKVEMVEAANLAELVHDRNLKSESLVIEHNGKIVKQDFWQETPINENDVVELLSFVGGG